MGRKVPEHFLEWVAYSAVQQCVNEWNVADPFGFIANVCWTCTGPINLLHQSICDIVVDAQPYAVLEENNLRYRFIFPHQYNLPMDTPLNWLHLQSD